MFRCSPRVIIIIRRTDGTVRFGTSTPVPTLALHVPLPQVAGGGGAWAHGLGGCCRACCRVHLVVPAEPGGSTEMGRRWVSVKRAVDALNVGGRCSTRTYEATRPFVCRPSCCPVPCAADQLCCRRHPKPPAPCPTATPPLRCVALVPLNEDTKFVSCNKRYSLRPPYSPRMRAPRSVRLSALSGARRAKRRRALGLLAWQNAADERRQNAAPRTCEPDS